MAQTDSLLLLQCYLLLRGQDYGALRQNPLVQAKPFALNNPFGPVIPDKGLKLVAVVFPQYHAFKENDRFWGTNFSEWTNLKLTFFNPWSFQPIKHPIQDHGGYYNFLDFEHRSRVGQLAKYYGIEVVKRYDGSVSCFPAWLSPSDNDCSLSVTGCTWFLVAMHFPPCCRPWPITTTGLTATPSSWSR